MELRIVRLFLSSVFLAACVHGALYYEYPEIRMEQYCDQTVYLTCPDSDSSSGRAGKLHFWIVPLENCSVSVQTSYCSTPHAVYFNIPRSDLAMEDFLEVYENVQTGSRGTLIKRIPGGSSPRSREPNSVAQLLTSYSNKQRLTFNLYIEPKTARNYSHEVVFDYTIVKNVTGPSETYCRALKGYIHSDIICVDSSDDRLNCPVAYYPTTGISNRAFRQQTCSSSTRLGTTRRGGYTGSSYTTTDAPRRDGDQTTRSYYGSPQEAHIDRSFDELKSLSIAAIFLLLVIGVLLSVFLTIFIMRLAGKPLPFIGPYRRPVGGDRNGDSNPLWDPSGSTPDKF
ncbi:uncharacterized protein LOC129588727 [Paramacrobiotus metropolitanus]|uniref:uncharacterized protein LOC129588727 n=1 Tax=Paramacrobiotus metropolitanus TaxID=2943436 RepID=UPI002445BBD5|nr:uncharacterized protein LOC129588727 [Paramacrobiotus metropolitanus]